MRRYIKHLLNVFFIINIVWLIPPALIAESQIPGLDNDQCVICHQENELMPEGFKSFDVHLQVGLSCSGCHGGDSRAEDQDISMSEKNGFIGVPSKDEIPEFCGKCHSKIEIMRVYQPTFPTDQVAQFYTSIHGIRLKKGDEKVADCINCHTAHGIIGANDPRSSVYPINIPQTCRGCHSNTIYMKEYNIPSNQYEEYAASVHGVALLENKDIGAPTCNDCHGNHGAMPPGISSISHVCGTCHVSNLNYFSSSPMAAPFEKSNLHSCEQCHGNHGVKKTSAEMIGVGENSVCINCHNDGDNGYIIAGQIKKSLDELISAQNSAIEKWHKVKDIEMDDEEIDFLLQEVNQDIIQSRTLVHLFDPDTISKKAIRGKEKTLKVNLLADKQIKDHQTRRIGFGAATIIIAILVLALYYKIREIEKKQTL